MAEAAQAAPAEPTEGATTEPQGTEEATDWEAKYKEAVEQSRKWEARAKANKAAAAKADKSAEEEIAELKARLDQKEKAEARAKLAAQVAQKKGVPADLLVGDTEKEMEAWADKMLAAFKPNPAAQVDKPGSFTSGEASRPSTG